MFFRSCHEINPTRRNTHSLLASSHVHRARWRSSRARKERVKRRPEGSHLHAQRPKRPRCLPRITAKERPGGVGLLPFSRLVTVLQKAVGPTASTPERNRGDR